MAKGNVKQQPHKLYHRHFKALAQAATMAIINGEALTYFRLPIPPEPLVREWPSGFPEVHIAEWGTDSHVWSCGSKKLLDWLHERGTVSYNAHDVYCKMQHFQIKTVLPLTSMVDEIAKGNW